ncbi:hypothetical protein HYV43_07420 [Candidatus Micrarchaeota archaeon]|nr:hypothetical protein [Candidatus Micrarchaeota archaeon]
MDQFKVLHLTRNGLLLLSSTQQKAVAKKHVLYVAGAPAAVVVDTIASTHDPLYLAEPLKEIKPGTVLRSKR